MPKRRSLVGTGREASGAPPRTPPESSAPPVKQAPRRATPQKAAARERSSAAPELREAERISAGSPASAYEAMVGFANAAMRQNLETGAKLARCKSPMEALAAQTAHAAALTQTFIAMSLKLMQLGFSTARWASSRRAAPRPEPH